MGPESQAFGSAFSSPSIDNLSREVMWNTFPTEDISRRPIRRRLGPFSPDIQVEAMPASAGKSAT